MRRARVIIWSNKEDEPLQASTSEVEVEHVSSRIALLDALDRRADVVCIASEVVHERFGEVLASIQRHASSPPPRVVWMTSNDEAHQLHEAHRAALSFEVCPPPLSPEVVQSLLPEHASEGGAAASLRTMFTQRYRRDDFVVQSEAMREVLALVARAARSRATVLIQGESGTGKEKVARFVHDQSPRADRPFVAINCKAFSPGVLESELFGHCRGAFTGATYRKQGVFERAHGGTLFLDEIGEVDVDFQGKLLRVLQEQEVLPVGATEPVKIDVRVVAATNRELNEEVRLGRFREDLLYRLAVIPVRVPALRERREEVTALAHHFMMRHAHMLGRTLDGWSEGVEQMLLAYHWPGNVRELENVMERACVLAEGAQIELEDLMCHTFARASSSPERHDDRLQQVVDEATREHLIRVLEQTRGRRQEAARLLGVERTTLYRLVKKYALDSH